MNIATTQNALLTPNDASLPAYEGPDAQFVASTPHLSAWVNASAGSGKTKVLVDRVLRLLLEGVPPHKILCLTFTNAAAAEMSIRIAEILKTWAVCEEADLQEQLDKLLQRERKGNESNEARRLFARVLQAQGGLRLMTIHAFAQEILKRFPIESGVSPHFALATDREKAALWQETRTYILQKSAADFSHSIHTPLPTDSTGNTHTPAVPEDPSRRVLQQALNLLLRSRQGSTIDQLLMDAAKHAPRFSSAINSAGSPDALYQKIYAALEIFPEDNAQDKIQNFVQDTHIDKENLLKAGSIIIEKGSTKFVIIWKIIVNWLSLPIHLRIENLYHYINSALLTEKIVRKAYANKNLLQDHPWIENVFLAEAERARRLCERLESMQVAEETIALIQLGLAVTARYTELKLQRGLLDYDDLINQVGELFAQKNMPSWVLYKLDKGIDHILVDEAQDTSPAQWRIISTLCEEFFSGNSRINESAKYFTPPFGATQGLARHELPHPADPSLTSHFLQRSLFVVGDEKQSIYSFQGADLATFSRMRAHFFHHAQAAQFNYKNILLNKSFRSVPAVLTAVDAIFAAPENRSGVSSAPVTHTAHRKQDAGRVEIWPLVKGVQEPFAKSPEDWTMPLAYTPKNNPAAVLAHQIAAQIQEWIHTGLPIADQETNTIRKVTAGDIMILVQKRGSFVSNMVSALKKAQVPVTGVDRMNLTKQLPVMDLMAVLQFILLPEDDLTLATILRCPLLSCSEELLMHLAIGRKGTLWESLEEKAETDAKLDKIRHYLRALSSKADFEDPKTILSDILCNPCPADSLSGRRAFWKRLGMDANEPIEELLTAAEEFCEQKTTSLQSFLCWLQNSETEIKRELDFGLGRVRIMTVHASKGLQAPVVILPDATTLPNEKYLPKILWDEKNNIPFFISKKLINPLLQNLRQIASTKQYEEYRRLFYVALTRAADRLTITGWLNPKNKQNQETAENGESQATPSRKKKPEDDAKVPSWYEMALNALQPLHDPAADQEGKTKPLVVLANSYDHAQPETQLIQPPALELPFWAYTQAAPEHALKHATPFDMEGQLKASISPLAALLSAPGPVTPPQKKPQQTVSADANTKHDTEYDHRLMASAQRAAPQPEGRFKRGQLIHRLLQSLPDIPTEKRQDLAHNFLVHAAAHLSPTEHQEILHEVFTILSDSLFAPLFGPQSKAEVSVCGILNGIQISGQIDRLCLMENEVWILDYKTNRPPPQTAAETPLLYQKQMGAYHALLKQIYPHKKLRCFLLWTYTPKLTELDIDLLPAA